MKEVRYEQPHIIIESNSNKEIVIGIDDYELFDFIEDYLIEQYSIEYTYMSESTDGRYYKMHFMNKYPFETLLRVIKNIDKNEIERIYQLNN